MPKMTSVQKVTFELGNKHGPVQAAEEEGEKCRLEGARLPQGAETPPPQTPPSSRNLLSSRMYTPCQES